VTVSTGGTIVIGVLAVLAYGGWRLNRHHPGRHVAAPLPVGLDDRFGSMCLDDELRIREELHHVDGFVPAPWEVLADPVEAHYAQVAEMLAAPVERAEPTEAEVAESRAAHGYIPELDSDVQPDPYIDAMAAEHDPEYPDVSEGLMRAAEPLEVWAARLADSIAQWSKQPWPVGAL
jgi:hypothetical protein